MLLLLGQLISAVDTKFSDIFDEKYRIMLEETAQDVIGVIGDLAVDSDGTIFLADNLSHCIFKYSSYGKLIKVIGRQGQGPGEFEIPFGVEISSDDKLCVVDAGNSRISVLSKDGKFIESFVTSPEAFIPLELKIDAQNNFYVSGLKFTKAEKEGFIEGLYIHKYRSNYTYSQSFHSMNPIVPKLNLFIERGVTFDLDKNGNIYCAEHIAYKIFKYSSDGRLLSQFDRQAPFYIPPPEFPKQTSEIAFRDWLTKWTPLIILVYHQAGFIIVQFRIHKPLEYAIEIYDTSGNFLAGNIQTAHRLLCFGKDGFLYFQLSGRPEKYKLGKFSIKNNLLRH